MQLLDFSYGKCVSEQPEMLFVFRNNTTGLTFQTYVSVVGLEHRLQDGTFQLRHEKNEEIYIQNHAKVRWFAIADDEGTVVRFLMITKYGDISLDVNQGEHLLRYYNRRNYAEFKNEYLPKEVFDITQVVLELIRENSIELKNLKHVYRGVVDGDMHSNFMHAVNDIRRRLRYFNRVYQALRHNFRKEHLMQGGSGSPLINEIVSRMVGISSRQASSYIFSSFQPTNSIIKFNNLLCRYHGISAYLDKTNNGSIVGYTLRLHPNYSILVLYSMEELGRGMKCQNDSIWSYCSVTDVKLSDCKTVQEQKTKLCQDAKRLIAKLQLNHRNVSCDSLMIKLLSAKHLVHEDCINNPQISP